MNILIADDSNEIRKILAESAKKEGYTVFTAVDGEEAVECFRKEKIDVVLLDVMMPFKDGFEVCRELRKTSNAIIILITARGEDFERIMGLDIGADDYIVKPFSPKEVMARVRAITRRIERTMENTENLKELRMENLAIHMDDDMIMISNQPIALTKKEMEILWTLAEHPGRVFTRNYLLDSLWGYDYYGDNRTVDSHIKRLRAKLDIVPHPTWGIQTVWGRGYKLEVQKHEEPNHS